MRNLVAFFSLGYDWELRSRDRARLRAPRDLADLPRKLDGYSEAALEYAFRLRDQAAALGDAARVWAVTLEDSLPEQLAQTLFAAGAEQIFTLGMAADALLTPQAASAVLSGFLGARPWDLLLMGQQESLACDVTLGVYLARRLGTPYLGPLSDLSLREDGLHLRRPLDGGIQQAVFSGPAVCAFANTEHPYLRIPTLRERLSILERRPKSLCVAAPPSRDTGPAALVPRARGRSLTWIAGETPLEKARGLLARVLPERGADHL